MSRSNVNWSRILLAMVNKPIRDLVEEVAALNCPNTSQSATECGDCVVCESRKIIKENERLLNQPSVKRSLTW